MTPQIFVGLETKHQYRFIKKIKTFECMDILLEVCKHTGISLSEISSKNRKRKIVEPRMMAIGLMLMHGNFMSLNNIGKLLGGLHHATVIHSRNTFNDLCVTNKNFKTTVDQIKSKLYGTA